MRYFSFGKSQPGAQSTGFGVSSPPPGYTRGPGRQVEPKLPAERDNYRPPQASWDQAVQAAEPQPEADEQGAHYKDADGEEEDDDEETKTIKVPSGSGKQTH